MNQNFVMKKCLFSGHDFIPKRSNQIFESTRYRNAYHNKKNRELRIHLSKINKQLIKNYKICIELLGNKEKVQVHAEYLRGKNFSFSVLTHLIEKSKGEYLFATYDTCYEKIDENNYNIIKL